MCPGWGLNSAVPFSAAFHVPPMPGCQCPLALAAVLGYNTVLRQGHFSPSTLAGGGSAHGAYAHQQPGLAAPSHCCSLRSPAQMPSLRLISPLRALWLSPQRRLSTRHGRAEKRQDASPGSQLIFLASPVDLKAGVVPAGWGHSSAQLFPP